MAIGASTGGLEGASAALAASWPWLAAAAAIAIAAAVALLLLRRRRPRPPRRLAPRHPVVLAHGLLGFDEIRLGRARAEYFRGVSARLERDGCVVHRCRVPMMASIADRAADLASFVRSVPGRRVNLVAHSMGGLDARYALSRLGLSRQVASLTTIGTPHLGTPLADVGTALPGRGVLAALRRAGMNVDAFDDLTTARMAEFNRVVPDARGVLYASVVGAPAARREVSPILVPTWLWLCATAGANDGVVPAASQRWGEVLREVGADHLAQIGWSRRFDAAAFYADLLAELRALGV